MKLDLRLTIVMVSMLVITACSSVPVSTIWKMSKLSPLEMDPSGVSIAVVTDQSVRFGKDSVRIEMSYKTASMGTSQDKKFVAQINDDALTLNSSDKKLLSSYRKSNEAINTFSLSKENAEEMRVMQGKVRAYKKNKVKGSGSFSIRVDDICLSDPNMQAVVADIFAKFGKTEDYILITRGVDLIKTMAKNGVSKQAILCQ